MKNAKVFGRVRENDIYKDLFECGCGHRDWITEKMETEIVYECLNCGERYILLKAPNRHYVVSDDTKNNRPR